MKFRYNDYYLKTVEPISKISHNPSPLASNKRRLSPKTVPKFDASRETSPKNSSNSKKKSI